MSRIHDLLERLCPGGVHFRYMWEVTTWDKKFNAVDRAKQPKVLKYNYLLAREMKPLIVEGGTVKLLTTNTSDLWTTDELAGDLVSEGEVVCIPWGGNPNVQYYKGRFLTADNRIAVVNDPSELNAKFLYYVMVNQLDVIGSFYRGSGIAHPNMAKVLDLKVPVPPVEVQREIVKALDDFTELEAELATELAAEQEARQLQYDHYRDTLLTFPDAVRRIPMGDLAGDGFFRDGDWVESKDQDESGSVRLTQLADVGDGIFRDRSDRWMREDQAMRLGCTLLEAGDVLIARMPDPLGRACQVPTDIGAAVTVVDVAILRSRRSDVLPRFVMHSINSHAVRQQILSFRAGGTRPRITRKNLATVEISIPSIEEQTRIVEILDRFETLVNSLRRGLPAELAARRQQYEYYRDKLLTFEEVAA